MLQWKGRIDGGVRKVKRLHRVEHGWLREGWGKGGGSKGWVGVEVGEGDEGKK